MNKKQASVFFTTRHEGIDPFDNYEDYYNADLDTVKKIFVVTRKAPTKKNIIPEAEVEIQYLSNLIKGSFVIGRKIIKGVESKVYKESSRYLKNSERNELNRQWKAAN